VGRGGGRLIRIGFDVGGTKLAAIAMEPGGTELARTRRPVPKSYEAILDAMREVTGAFEKAHGEAASIGIGLPGVISRDGVPLRVANLPWLEHRPLAHDLETAVGRPSAMANDANCFALSEATDGAAAGTAVVFGAVLGTGVGGGIVVHGRPLVGRHGIAGEWGHSALPFRDFEAPWKPVRCGCGRTGCIETWLNGEALARDFQTTAGRRASADEVGALVASGDPAALAAMTHYAGRLARALAGVINLLDPDIIVLGGGLSAIAALYERTPELWRGSIVAPEPATRLVPARFGTESGLRGAAWLSVGA
jgi:fructokinase